LEEGMNLQMNILLYSNHDVDPEFELSLSQKVKQQEEYQIQSSLLARL